MIKINTLRALKECGVVAVVRGNSKEVGVEISKACVKGGVKALEVTYTNKFANDIIKELSEIYEGQDDVVIGAGTVLDAETARAAMLAGAKYIVSPAFDLETAKICNRYKVPYLPGIMTINEIIAAHEAGVDFVKLFPGSAFGQGYVKAIKGPLPYANIMVTGGVNIDNLDSWIKAGVDAVGIGGELNKLGEEGKFDEITAICEQYMAKLHEARGC
ncbi:MAG: bifunctional 4-hydroxy-2-oxoglutarate aldolase/2-dehydro-3-deoxy-phosphogluconate aldolase [Clostridiales bacterium]|jgi:2-dehydro-3-deoxyphosphogluconate aldolase/(4S)-4-hydroxy-2-oxoglutarate aldolase|uniref:bifunctional 4-hydroxy-2-oxoglutarate aldolase/2-dehydro-3-deoxy-phosphogluconate aldolase n=1 Tax=Intestinibacter sp. TaxID=1965304 RepID=UPI0025DEF5F6|nr:bifunctional 4-hydroxy-2-oxoglutarate aldolase/2-dehydro-3-deoxy-phosphogluconate aldolase [uncultured Intestinibacter sp.]MDU1202777.1 bifunctional 4-hydroxy-2-oxoglutarate aldolase/2-dehydro-3-deoxy-phosphogluconate aldolase [Clostridiales bacterium]